MPRLRRPMVGIFVFTFLIGLHFVITNPSIPQSRYRQASGAYRDALGRVGPHRQEGPQAPHLNDGPSLDVDARGLVSYVVPVGPTHGQGAGRHPIVQLIKRGKELAAKQEARIRRIDSLAASSNDYQQAFGMRPPRGYEHWYKFTQENSPPTPPLPSLFPLVHEPFLALLSHPPDILRPRVEALRNQTGYYTLTFVPDGQGDMGTACTSEEDWYPEDWHERGRGMVLVRGVGAWSWRCNNTLTLMLPILPLMPDELFHSDPPLELAFSLADGPRSMVHDSFRTHSEALARAGEMWPKAQLHKAEQGMRWTHGWHWACPADSPLKLANSDVILNGPVPVAVDESSVQSFIADPVAAADFCHNPDLMPFHHVLLADQHASPAHLIPCVVACRTARNADIVGVPLDAVFETIRYTPWEEKTLSKVFWRLHFFAHNERNASVSVMLDDPEMEGGVGFDAFSVQEMNEQWLDVGLSGKPVQCKQEDGSCDDMAREIRFLDRVRKEDAIRFKFVVDVDGNGWSSRFRRLLLGNNVVLKSTLYPEWFSTMLIPWYHYVPLKLDYTDMYDILAFFMGAPDGSSVGRDDLAQQIAENGLRFAQEKWRVEDMQSFMFLLILEYWRLMSPDRQEASYTA